ERPEIISLLCLATWLLVLSRAEQRVRWLWFLPLLQIVWINCHALYILGLAVGACYVVDLLVRMRAAGRWGLDPAPKRISLPAMVRTGTLCVAAALVNPYLEEGAFFPFVLLRKITLDRDFYSMRIGEFKSPLQILQQNGWTNPFVNTALLL